MATIIDVQREIPVFHDVDIAVLGGGTAGTIAAITAARLGARTVVIERAGTLGGTMTTGLMASMTNKFYDAKENKVTGGLPREVLERLVAEGGTLFPDVEDTLRGKMGRPFTVPFQPSVLSYVLLKMAQEAGVRIMLHTQFSHLIGDGPRPKGFVVVNKSGQGAILAKAMIDASGDADLAVAAGAPYIGPKEAYTWGMSTWGLLMRIGNVNFDKVIGMVKGLKSWEPWPEFGKWLSNHLGIPLEQLEQAPYWKNVLDPIKFMHAPSEIDYHPGTNDKPDPCCQQQPVSGVPTDKSPVFTQRYDWSKGNLNYSPGKLQWIIDRWEKEGLFYNIDLTILRHKVKEAVEAGDLSLVKKIEGFGEIRLNWDGFGGGAWGPNVVLTNSCHACAGFDGTNGEHVSRAEVEGRIFNMEIARFFKKYIDGFENSYVIDMGGQFVPRCARMIQGEYRVTPEDVHGQGQNFHDTIFLWMLNKKIPYRALVPKNVDNILVAGKCGSGAESYRSIPNCMSSGQAAATAAVLMAESGTANRDVDIKILQKMLREQGVILDASENE